MKDNMTKQVCGRCGGTGHYSFNQKDGTVCYGCGGSGFVMVDLAKIAKSKAAFNKKQEVQNANRTKVISASIAVREKFNSVMGNFDITTEFGIALLNKAVYQSTGHDLTWHRDEMLNQKEG